MKRCAIWLVPLFLAHSGCAVWPGSERVNYVLDFRPTELVISTGGPHPDDGLPRQGPPCVTVVNVGLRPITITYVGWEGHGSPVSLAHQPWDCAPSVGPTPPDVPGGGLITLRTLAPGESCRLCFHWVLSSVHPSKTQSTEVDFYGGTLPDDADHFLGSVTVKW